MKMYDGISYRDAGTLIGKYLRETNRITEEYLYLTDEEIGEEVFKSHPQGDLFVFYNLYNIAKDYYKNIDYYKNEDGVK